MKEHIQCGIFVICFNFGLISYLLSPYFVPRWHLTRRLNFFESSGVNFITLLGLFMLIAFMLTVFIYNRYLSFKKKSSYKNQFGGMLLRMKLKSRKELEESLFIQNLTIGELLVKEGLITEAQRDIALEHQKNNYKKMGEILIALGFLAEDDIQWALSQKKKHRFDNMLSSHLANQEQIVPD